MKLWTWFERLFRQEKRNSSDVKKSCLLSHQGGQIWILCLDNLNDNSELIKKQILDNERLISQHDRSYRVLYHLDGTEVSNDIAIVMIDSLIRARKYVNKLAIVGVTSKGKESIKRCLSTSEADLNMAFKYYSDMEMAKDWLISERH